MADINWRTGEPPRNGNYLVDTGDEFVIDYWFVHTWDDYGDNVKGWMPIEGDIAEVVLCKDCKFSSPNGVYGCRLESFANTPSSAVRLYSKDFCSRGIRRNG